MIIVGLCALVDDDERVYLTQRSLDADKGGFWEFPGGKLKQNETAENCIIREIYEELRIDISKNCLAPVTFSFGSTDDNKTSLLLLLYLCRKWHGTPLAFEASRGKWVRIKRIQDFKMPPANQNMVAFLRDILIY